MEKTVAKGFQEFGQRLEITDLQATTVSMRQQKVREAVKKGLVVVDDFLTGSYMRNTMIAPLKDADVDIFIVLDDQYYRYNGQAFILNKVKDVLKDTYPTSQISRNGQAVTISFSDSETLFSIGKWPYHALKYQWLLEYSRQERCCGPSTRKGIL